MADQVSYVPSFYPVVKVSLDSEGIFDVAVGTVAPNSCFHVAAHELALPPGIDFSIPEYAHLLCHTEYTGGSGRVCLMWRKPLHWVCEDLKLGTGKTHIYVHIVVAKTVVAGSILVPLPDTKSKFISFGDDLFPWPW